MRFVFLADTHMLHEQIHIPHGDVLVFCGDMCARGTTSEAIKASYFFSSLKHAYKIIIPGNHDWPFMRMHASAIIPDSMHYLCDSKLYVYPPNKKTVIVSETVFLYGMPWTPLFCDWAFMLPRKGPQLKARIDAIPNNIDILVTHGPPKGIRDEVPHYDKNGVYINSTNEGCELLRERVFQVRPKVHVFGHIHETPGFEVIDGILFINATICNGKYAPVHKPVVLDYIDNVATIVSDIS